MTKEEFETCIALLRAFYEWQDMDSNAQGAFGRARWAVNKLANDLGVTKLENN